MSASAGAPPTTVLRAGTLIVRIHHAARGAVFFGPSPGQKPGNRFDAPNGEYSVLYASRRLEGAFVETILRRPKGRILRADFVNERAYTVLRLERSLRLAKLFDEGLQAFGVDAGEIGADTYALPANSRCAFMAAVWMVSPTDPATTTANCVTPCSTASPWPILPSFDPPDSRPGTRPSTG